jgi:hypothetical protein
MHRGALESELWVVLGVPQHDDERSTVCSQEIESAPDKR